MCPFQGAFLSSPSEIQRDELVRGGIFRVLRGGVKRSVARIRLPKPHRALVSLGMTPVPSPPTAGPSWHRRVPRGRVSGLLIMGASRGPSSSSPCCSAPEEALWGHQPWSGGGKAHGPGVGRSPRAREICGWVPTAHFPTSPEPSARRWTPMLTLEEQQLQNCSVMAMRTSPHRFLE